MSILKNVVLSEAKFLLGKVTRRTLINLKNNNVVERVFISIKRNELHGSFGVGILASNNDCLGDKAWCLRFMERDKLLFHQLCSLIYVYQRCNLNNNKKLILMDPIIDLDLESSKFVEEIVPYMNTIYPLLSNRDIKIEKTNSMYSICNRLAYFAADTSNTLGMDQTIILFGGKRINLKFLFSE